MSAEKKAAVDMDAIQDQTLDQIRASDFLAALNAGGLAAQHLAFWPEKKKLEYWTEPENLGKIRFKDIFEKIRVEKKKLELEVDPWIPKLREGWNPVPIPEKKKYEQEVDPGFGGGFKRMPEGWGGDEKKKVERELDFGMGRMTDDMLDRLADAVARRLERGR